MGVLGDTYPRNILEAEDIWLVETCKKKKKTSSSLQNNCGA
jgi:hypothetical protein